MALLQADGANRYRLTGAMTFASVADLRRAGRRVLREGSGAVSFDLSGVDAADSAGLALLVDWLAFAAAHQRELRFEQLPASLRALADITDVQPMLAGDR